MPYWFDGNNLIGQSAAAAKDNPGNRRAFLAALSDRHISRGGRFLVYFDGDDPDRSQSPPGVAVRYSAPLSADEAILRRLDETRRPSEIIVVTNDRKLAVQCRSSGASTLSWSEFDSQTKDPPTRGKRKTDPQERVDVEDWLEYFGLKKTGR